MPNNENLPYTHISEELNDVLVDIMTDWRNLVIKAKNHGLDIKFAPDSKHTLELYFHDDYPYTILVDKDISCERNI